jgi:hypothetical protein
MNRQLTGTFPALSESLSNEQGKCTIARRI